MKLIGHVKQWQYLKGLVKSERTPHALLFSGPKQVGKRFVALEFVKLLNRDMARAEQDIEKGQYPDLVVVEPSKGTIHISQIRDLAWKLSLRSYAAPLKAAIIDQAHTMNQEAQSCLLKTLEEPKGRALLILVSEHPDVLLPTIRSRTEQVMFFPVGQTEMDKHFPKEIVALSAGRPGRAINFLQNPEKLKEQKQRLQELSQLGSLTYAQRFAYAQNLSNAPQYLPEILELWLQRFRGQLKGLKPDVRPVKAIENTLFLLSSTNVNPRLALENLMLEI